VLIGALLILFGILLIVVNPLLGLIPGLVLIIAGILVVVLGGTIRGVGALLGTGPKRCPDCRSKIDSRASVCPHCGHRFG
jgi:hypothetical protein